MLSLKVLGACLLATFQVTAQTVYLAGDSTMALGGGGGNSGTQGADLQISTSS
jgi:hypothetical protein